MFSRDFHHCKKTLTLVIVLLLGAIALTGGYYSNSSAQSADEGLVVWLPLDEGSGRDASDASGNNNDGRLQGQAEWIQGQFGNAVDLVNPPFNNNSPDWIQISPDESQNLNAQVSLAAWIRVVEFNNGAGIITKGENITSYALRITGDRRLMFTANFGEPFGWEGSGDWFSSGSLSANVWHHVAVTYDGNFLRFYIDGAEDPNTSRLDLVFGRATQPLFIGADFPDDDQFFDGAIDEVRVYSRALSPTEVRTISTPANRPPSLTLPSPQSSVEGENISLSIQATDPEEDDLVFDISGLPQGLGYDSETGRITGILDSGSAGNYTIFVSVTDEQGSFTSGSFEWIIREPTTTPTDTPTPTYTPSPTVPPTDTPVATVDPEETARPTDTPEAPNTPTAIPTTPTSEPTAQPTAEPTLSATSVPPVPPDGQQNRVDVSQTFLLYQDNGLDNRIRTGDILLFQTVISNTGSLDIAEIQVDQVVNPELLLVPDSMWLVQLQATDRRGEQLPGASLPLTAGPIPTESGIAVVYQMTVQIDPQSVDDIKTQAYITLPGSEPQYASLISIPVARDPMPSGQVGGGARSIYLPLIE